MRIRFQLYAQRIRNWWNHRSKVTRSFAEHLVAAFRNFSQQGTSRAASLSYYAIFSIFPLTLLIAVLINQLLGPTVAQEQIARGLSFFLPEDTVGLIRDNVVDALEQGGGFTLVAVIGLAWSGLGLFSNLSNSLEEIFRASKPRNLWQSRVIAVAMAIILMVLIILSFITSGVLRLLDSLLNDSSSPWLSIGSFFLPLAVNMLIFVLMFRYIPRRVVHWEVIWPVAILGSAGWELAKYLFVWYLNNFGNYAVVYGSIAIVIVLLLATYLTATVVILSAEICARMNEWFDKYYAGRRFVMLNALTRDRSRDMLRLPGARGKSNVLPGKVERK